MYSKEECDKAYFVDGKPLITDLEYDLRFGVNNNTIGFKSSSDDVKLPFKMPSMNKEDGDKFHKKFNNKFYYVMDKIDGVSCLYHKGKFYSRGNGVYGKDISHLNIKFNYPKNKTIRGELSIKNTPLNKISGYTQRQSDTSKELEFLAFEYIDDTFNDIKSRGKLFQIPKRIENLNDLPQLLEYRRKKSKYHMDGLIIYTSDKYYRESRYKNPSYAFAYKELGEIKETTVKNIEWDTSRHGYLIPKLIIEEIILQDKKINKLTGHNARNILDKKIGIGSKIEVILSGDIIPNIYKVITTSKKNNIPKIKREWDGVNLISNDNERKSNKNFLNMFRKLKLKGIGKKKMDQIDFKRDIEPNLFNLTRAKLIDVLNIYKNISLKRLQLIFENGNKDFSEENILSIKGIGKKIYDEFDLHKHKLKDLFKKYKSKTDDVIDYGNKFCVLSGFRVKENSYKGYIVENNITSKTNIVFQSGDKITNKIKKATEKKIKIEKIN